jgi:hypothetical protein
LNWELVGGVGTAVSALAAAVAVLMGLQTYRRQANAQVFLEYTKRYREVMADFPRDARRALLDLQAAPPPRTEDLSLAVLRYLNLCSEEFYLWRTGYLADDVWRIWEGELNRTLRSPLLVREWASLHVEFEAYPEFRQYVTAHQNAVSPETSAAVWHRVGDAGSFATDAG